MSFLIDFLRQEVPRSSKNMPGYYRKALFISESILTAYFLVSLVMLVLTTGRWAWVPSLVLLGIVACLLNIEHMTARLNLAFFSTLIGIWLVWYVYMFGWSSGSPHILIPILSMVFFNIYEPPAGKIAYCLGLIIFRVGLFAYSLNHTPVSSINPTVNLAFQIVNSVMPLLILAINYILFSSSIQASERQLIMHNQELHIEAGTDPLTGLPNRRALLDSIESYRKLNPESQFSIAIADIDFFKKVNDTYGHNCGDYTLKELSQLFLAHAENAYSVCRWGGEEFSFFLPGKNLDQAGVIMTELHGAVRKMNLHYGDVDFKITITIGLEEYDFNSPTEVILDRADRKLYMGKVHGRDQVVI